MDEEIQALLWTFGMDIAFFAMCWGVKFVQDRMANTYGHKSTNVPTTINAYDESDEVMDEAKKTFMFPTSPSHQNARIVEPHEYYPWPVNKLMEYWGDARVLHRGSNLYWVLTRFRQLAISLLVVMSIPTIGLLMPIYYFFPNAVDGKNVKTILQEASMQNVNNSALSVLAFVVAAAIAVLVWQSSIAFVQESTRFDISSSAASFEREGLLSPSLSATHTSGNINGESIMSRTIHITNVNRVNVSETTDVMTLLESCFPAQQQFVHVVPHMGNAHELHAKFQSLSHEIDRARAHEAEQLATEAKNRAATRCRKLLEEHADLTQKLRDSLDNAMKDRALNSGHIFVTFKTSRQAKQALAVFDAGEHCHCNGAKALHAERWTVTMAPSSSDIIWKNISVSNAEAKFRRIVGPLTLFAVMILIITPTTALSPLRILWKDIRGVRPENDESLVLFSSQLPSLAVFLVNALILPFLIEKVTIFERHLLRSEMERSATTLHSIFLFINVVMLPTLALNSIAAFFHSEYTADISHWQDRIGAVLISSAGQFFMHYLIHAALLGPAAELIDLSQVLYRWMYTKRARTRTEMSRAQAVWQYDFGFTIAYSLTLFGLALLYSVTVPLIIPFALLYFITSYMVVNIVIESGVRGVENGRLATLAPAVAAGNQAYVVLFLFAISSVLAIQRHSLVQATGLAMFVAGLMAGMKWILQYSIGEKAMLKISGVVVDNEPYDVYKHPLLRFEPEAEFVSLGDI